MEKEISPAPIALRCASIVYKHAAELAAFGESLLIDEDGSLSDLGYKLLDEARAYLEEFHGELDYQLSPEGQKEIFRRLSRLEAIQ